MKDERREFLMRMYDQMFNDINRHILVVWQSIGVIVGAFAIFALVEKQIISVDMASAMVLLLAAWSVGHVIDSSYWYNRNLVIIANIERQFLTHSDARDIQFYFSAHRKNNKMISHLELQLALALGLAALVTLYHFSKRVYPGLTAPFTHLEPERALPYTILVAAIPFLIKAAKKKNERYAEFLERSPGKEVTSAADGAIGHGQR